MTPACFNFNRETVIFGEGRAGTSGRTNTVVPPQLWVEKVMTVFFCTSTELHSDFNVSSLFTIICNRVITALNLLTFPVAHRNVTRDAGKPYLFLLKTY